LFVAIDDKVAKTLSELGVADAAGVQSLFGEVRAAVQAEREVVISQGAPGANDRDKLAKQLRDRWLARKNGLLAQIDDHWLKSSAKELKPVVGREFNELRRTAVCLETEELTRAMRMPRVDSCLPQTNQPPQGPDYAAATFASGSTAGPPFPRVIDLTLPGYCRPLGSIHPITRVQREIEDIFLGLGFAIETGPEVESVYYNFDALNIPESHPSRDDWDTLYIDSQTVLRTHTSPVQIRAMEKYGAPLYIIIPGKCYRNDKPDASHSPMFHQMEGLAVDTDITFADLKGTLEFFAKKFFGETVRTSFRPSFFPFTEPSGEVYVSCAICDGQGCSVCKQSGWIEVMGCGMVHPQVLRNGGIDPDRYSGWAFGLGIDRFAMMKYGIDDIQLFFQSDLRFLEQF
jgi:phenylalanyl-tRNA synthetase alpha chain